MVKLKALTNLYSDSLTFVKVGELFELEEEYATSAITEGIAELVRQKVKTNADS